jgi:putative DNA primase/helicase
LAFPQLIDAAIQCGLSQQEAERTTESGLDAGMEHPRSSKALGEDETTVAETSAVVDLPDPALLWMERPKDFELLDYSAEDGGILDLWFDLYGKERMFTVGYDSWFVWSGTHWQKDEDLYVEGEIERLMDSMNAKAKAGLAQSSGDKESLRMYSSYVAATKRSKSRVASVEGMARSRCAARSAVLNNGNTLNLSNGVLDLDTFELRPHAPEERLTYCLSYAYDPDADCQRFKRFLSEVLVKDGTTETDEELVQLYREAMGYALTTDTRHEAMFWLSGDGGNGKTVAITMLQKILGPLCFSVSFEEMGRPSNYDLAEVAGKRVVFSTESERGGKLAEGHIKRIVSGERINARPIYGSPFEFHSTAKVFWGMNDLPVVRDTSNGVWRRLKLIPFLRTFTEKDRDPGLIGKLEKELSGILNLALQGLKDLRERGRFPESRAVATAVDEYRHENNPVQQWMDERTQPTYTPNQQPSVYPSTGKAVFEDYRVWSEQNGRQTMNSTNFGRELRRLKIPKSKDVRGVVYPLQILE